MFDRFIYLFSSIAILQLIETCKRYISLVAVVFVGNIIEVNSDLK